MEAVPKRNPLRVAVVLLAVPALAFILVRAGSAQLTGDEVRHGVSAYATVIDVGDEVVTVRIALPDRNVTAQMRVRESRDYVVGSTIAVVYDPVDPTRASERGAAPAPSGASRAVLVLAGLGVGAALVWAAGPGRPKVTEAEHHVSVHEARRPASVGGGRDKPVVADSEHHPAR